MRLYSLTLLIFALISWPSVSHADIQNDLVSIQCNQDLNFLEIRYLGINGAIPQDYVQKNPEELWEKYNLVAVDNLFNINVKESRQTEKGFKAGCTLRTQKDPTQQVKEAYTILINGYAANANPNGMCGGDRSFVLDILTASGQKLVDQLHFSPGCEERRAIRSIIFLPHEGYMFVDGDEYIGSADGKISLKGFSIAFWLDQELSENKLPVNDEKIFRK